MVRPPLPELGYPLLALQDGRAASGKLVGRWLSRNDWGTGTAIGALRFGGETRGKARNDR